MAEAYYVPAFWIIVWRSFVSCTSDGHLCMQMSYKSIPNSLISMGVKAKQRKLKVRRQWECRHAGREQRGWGRETNGANEYVILISQWNCWRLINELNFGETTFSNSTRLNSISPIRLSFSPLRALNALISRLPDSAISPEQWAI